MEINLIHREYVRLSKTLSSVQKRRGGFHADFISCAPPPGMSKLLRRAVAAF